MVGLNSIKEAITGLIAILSLLIGFGTFMIYVVIKFYIGFRSFLPFFILWLNGIIPIWFDPSTGELYEFNIFLIIVVCASLFWLSTR